MRALVCVVTMLAALSSRAEADTSKAWAAARDNLPASTRAVGALDVAAIVKTAAFGKIFELVMKEERDLREAHALVKKACQVDPLAVIEGVVVAGDPRQDAGVVFLQLSLDRAKATACLEATLRAMGNPKAQLKLDGNIAAVSVGRDTAYLAWVTGDVVAISLEPEKKDALQAWIGQKGAFAKTASGALALAKGTVSGSVRGTFADAKGARDAQAEMQKEITKELGRKSTPEPMKRVLKAISVAAKGSEVTVAGSAAEADLLECVMAMMK